MIFYGILLAIFSTVFGQFFRIAIGSGGILFLDILLPILTFLWIIFSLRKNKNPLQIIKKFPLFWAGFSFFSLSTASLFFAGSELSFRDFLESGFYLFRYFFLLIFPVIVADELSGDEKKQRIFLYSIFSIAGILAILGFMQLKFFPDFTQMQKFGWDPHIGRLLSTWFDPNFLGGFFAFILILLGGIVVGGIMNYKLRITNKEKIYISVIPQFMKAIARDKNCGMTYIVGFLILNFSFLIAAALLFTFSRSALLAFVIPAFFLGIFYLRGIFLLGIIGISLLLPFSPRAIDRISDGINSGISIFQEENIFLPDATARLRVENFSEGVDLSEKYFWTGVGFNTIRLHRQEKLHSSGGFDSSFLTVFATTGIFGLLAFLWMWVGIAKISFQKFLYSKNFIKKYLSLGFFWSIFGVLVQSFFINNLFYSLFLVLFFGVFGWMVSYNDTDKKV